MEPLPPPAQQEPGLQVHSAQQRKPARGTVWGWGWKVSRMGPQKEKNNRKVHSESRGTMGGIRQGCRVFWDERLAL